MPNKKKSFWFSAVMLILGLLLSIVSSHQLTSTMEQDPVLAPPKQIKHFTFGFSETIADSLWLRVIQHADYCENKNAPKASNRNVELDKILTEKLPPSRCHKGWVYQMFDVITDLAPRFDYIYKIAGVLLSIGSDDREGAKLIFDKGLNIFPNDWILNFYAAYHYLFEIQDGTKAAELMLKASKSPRAPPALVPLAARLLSREGKVELGIKVLEDYIATSSSSEGVERAKFRLKQLKSQLSK